MKNRIIGLALALAMVLSLICVPGVTFTAKAADENPFAGGTGKQDDPYQIATADQLIAWSTNNGAPNYKYGGDHFVLTDNIDLTGKSWTPIENFNGTLDGQNHTITGLTVSSGSYGGLFRFIRQGGVVKNLKMAEVNITASMAGAIAAGFRANGTSTAVAVIDNCYVMSGTVKGTATYNGAGGIVGMVSGQDSSASADIVIRNCVNAATVTSEASGEVYVGGIVGGALGSASGGTNLVNIDIQNCANLGALTSANSNSKIGGIVGRALKRNAATLTVTHCYNAGVVTSDAASSSKGSIVGQNSSATVSGCYGLAVTNGNTTGFTAKTADEMQDPTFAATLNANVKTDMAMYWIAAESQYPLIDTTRAAFWATWKDIKKTPAQVNGVYQIGTAEELAGMADYSANSYVLTADIDLSGREWTSVKDFRGTFDGQGHTITGLTITQEASGEDSAYYGLFGKCRGGVTVKNVVLADVNIGITRNNKTNFYVGAVMGFIVPSTSLTGNVTIDNCSVVSGTISMNSTRASGAANGAVGGIVGGSTGVGTTSDIKIINCYNGADITVTENGTTAPIYVGGIAGLLEYDKDNDNVKYSIVNCGAVGKITVKGTPIGLYLGGIAGRARVHNNKAANTTLNNCYSNASFAIEGTVGSWGTNQDDIVPNRRTGDTAENLYGVWDAGAGETKMTAAEMKAADFVATLNGNVAAIDGAKHWYQTAAFPKPGAAKIGNFNITLEGIMDANFELRAAADDVSAYTWIVKINGEEEELTSKPADSQYGPRVAAKLFFYEFQNNTTISATLNLGEIAVDTFEFELKDYINDVKDSQTGLSKVFEALLNYGTYGKYYVDSVAGEPGTAPDGLTQEPDEKYTQGVMAPSSGIIVTLFLDNACDMLVKVPVSTYQGGTIKVGEAEAVELSTLTVSGEYYIYRIDEILVQDWAKLTTFVITPAEGDSVTVTVSPMAYFCNMMEVTTNGLDNLVKAMYQYHEAVVAWKVN